ncbi:MAG: hypothetical protein ABRQ25_08930 [Clostridiaceae bacterium]
MVKMTREEITKIAEENNLKTVTELLEYMDNEEFLRLVDVKIHELENGSLKFRYKDKAEVLKNYQRCLYQKMISEGKMLSFKI